MHEFEGLKPSVEKVATDVVELEVDPKMCLNYCNLMLKLMHEELLHMDKQRKWFPEMLSTPGEDAMKIAEMTTNGFLILHKLS